VRRSAILRAAGNRQGRRREPVEGRDRRPHDLVGLARRRPADVEQALVYRGVIVRECRGRHRWAKDRVDIAMTSWWTQSPIRNHVQTPLFRTCTYLPIPFMVDFAGRPLDEPTTASRPLYPGLTRQLLGRRMMKIYHNGTLGALNQPACAGPIAPYIGRFAKFLASEGYVAVTINAKLALVTDLSRWLERRGLSLAELDERTLKQFYNHRSPSIGRGDVYTGRQLLEFLRSTELIPARSQKLDSTALGKLMQDYQRFLSSECGLARSTVTGYLRIVRRFLTEQFEDRQLHFEELRPQDLNRFILGQAQRVSRVHASATVTALRSFLRFSRQRGTIKMDLATSLFGVARWRLSHIPSLPPGQVKQLLQCCDRNSPSGQRDYAILLLLARLVYAAAKCSQ
jgi:site-specific recombinase XerD